MHITPQERLALGVTALLIAAGAGVRVVGSDAPPVEWTAAADTLNGAGISMLRAEVEAGAAERRRAATPLGPGERLDPSSAPAVELDRLPRVGPALAARIVSHREAHGAFRTLGDLDQVTGIGPSLLDGIAPHLTLVPGPPTAAHTAAAGAGSSAETPRRRIDINRATEEELLALPGIGPALARRIVEWRRENGRFDSPESLEQVSGIGPALRARIAPLVTMDN